MGVGRTRVAVGMQFTISLIRNKPLAKYGCVTGKKKAKEKRKRGFGVWTLPKETGKDRWKIIWEGCLIRCGGGRGGTDGWFFHCQRERTAKSN